MLYLPAIEKNDYLFVTQVIILDKTLQTWFFPIRELFHDLTTNGNPFMYGKAFQKPYKSLWRIANHLQLTRLTRTEGFEPPETFRPRRFSRPVYSSISTKSAIIHLLISTLNEVSLYIILNAYNFICYKIRPLLDSNQRHTD